MPYLFGLRVYAMIFHIVRTEGSGSANEKYGDRAHIDEALRVVVTACADRCVRAGYRTEDGYDGVNHAWT